MSDQTKGGSLEGIAIVGMSGRFPGAKNINEFWENLKNGVESVSRFNDAELEVGNNPQKNLPNYVKAKPILENADMFDAAFFGIYPKEAEVTDPQHRVFLECAWEALEDAGYDSLRYPGLIGVFAGCSLNTYFLSNVCTNRGVVEEFTEAYQVGCYQTMVGANPDFLSTRVSYKLDLRGPSFTMGAGCSTSLVAICQAAQSLLSYQSDMALAGGVSITFPQKRGYLYLEEGMVSPDGHCRTFDEKAQGTIFGHGAGVVLLKRLEDAVADGDHVYAVIKGFAVNNDGAQKVGYAAPSIEGQSQVIVMAQAAAEVDPESITYIEAHGTGTPLGDPIEVAALTKAFRTSTQAKNFCAIGSSKPNVGHLDVAAGVTGLIKTVLSLKHQMLPPSLHFERPNPKIDFANSPFFVNTKLTKWERNGTPLRAGVSALGVGGTNAHVILEESPGRETAQAQWPNHLLVLSAKSEAALKSATENLSQHLQKNPAKLADVAYTLQVGRRPFEHRRMLVASDDVQDAARALESVDPKRVFTSRKKNDPGVMFMFPGQGSQFPGMGQQLYKLEPRFRETVDQCAEILKKTLGVDLRTVLYPADPKSEEAKNRLNDTFIAQPAIFTIEYAMAKLWMNWGVTPQAMIGHSIGEFVAACLAGVFSLEDALGIVAARGRLMQDLPRGAMLSVRLSEKDLQPLLGTKLSMAAINGPLLTVASGENDAIAALEEELKKKNVPNRRLHTSHAFHSAMMDPIIAAFTARVKEVKLKAPTIPYVSCVTGTWITAADATDPKYWASHFRQPVRFLDGINQLSSAKESVLLEVGAGNTLATLARQRSTKREDEVVVSSLPDSSAASTDSFAVLNAVGRLWIAGVDIDWNAFYGDAHPNRVSLPTYPFERKRFWHQGATTSPLPETAYQVQPVELKPVEEANAAVNIETTHNMSSNLPSADRLSRLKEKLTGMFAGLSGMEASALESSASFLELGFDSLFLTQVVQELQSAFHVKLTFRQLLDQQSSIDALAQYLDLELAPEVLAPEKAVVSAPVVQSISALGASLPAGSSVTAVERLIAAQNEAMKQLMAQQLAALSAATGVTGPGASGVVAAQAAQPKPQAAPGDAAIQAETDAQKFKPFGPYKPVQRGATGSLTAKQEKYLADLMKSYVARTKKSKEYTQTYRKPFADPRVAGGFRSQWKEMVYPIVTDRSEGSKLFDLDGNEYIDILNGFGPILFGHAPKFVVEAVQEQIKKGFEIGPQAPLAGKVAAQICELIGMDRATFCNTGSEAVMAAMRVARTVTGRNKIVTFTGDYHGTFDEVLVRGVRKPGGDWSATPIAPGIPKQKAENIFVLDYDTAESLAWIRAHADELAAVLIEPVQSRHPSLQPKEFCKELRRITETSGTALIFDEVVTGFRSHPGGVQALWGIRADLATYGKVIGGGMPIGVLAGSSRFMDALDGGMWQYGDESYPEVGVTFFAGTFVRHPLAMAATHAVLNHMKAEGPQMQERLNETTARLVAEINAFLEEKHAPTRLETFSSMFFFSFPPDLRFASLFYYHMREKGIHILEGFPCFLTTAHTDKDLARVVQAFKESITEMQAGGALPSAEEASAIAAGASASLEAPLTQAQIEIMLSAQLGDAASCAYNESFNLKLEGDLDRKSFEDALDEVIARYEILRATIKPRELKMVFGKPKKLNVPFVDLSSEPKQTSERRLQEIVANEAALPFDMETGPLWRAQLVRMDKATHYLVVTSHHMACDGWSTNIILDELGKLYSAKRSGEKCELPEPLQFGEYARTVSKELAAQGASETEAYWLKQFARPITPLNLPVDRSHPAMKSFAGATYRKTIDIELYKKVRTAGAKHGCTSFVTLLAGFYALLARLTNQDDLVVGIPAAAQSQLPGKTLVGHCVNLLPVRAFPESKQPFSEFLGKVKTTLLDAYDHQNYTYGTLVRKLQLPRDTGRLPLLEVQFNVEKVGAAAHFTDLKADVDPNPKRFANFDMFLNVQESDRGLTIDCDYNTDVFDEATIARWMQHYEVLLASIAADSKLSISNLSLMSAAEEKQLVVDWNATAADYPRNRCVHLLIEEQATATPDKIALQFDEERLTYAELNRRANQLANHLRSLGIGEGKVVGLFIERSSEMMVGLLGIMKSGAAYIPLDPTYPKDRLAYVLQETSAPVVLTQAKLRHELSATKSTIVTLDEDWPQIAKSSEANPKSATDSEALAYVIFTSGSTGKPKGVAVSHRAVVNLLTSVSKRPGMTASDTMLAVTTLSFDIAGLELYLPLIVGGTLVVVSRELASDGLQLASKIAAVNATIMQATPVTWKLLVESGWQGKADFKALVGGEAVPRELVNQLAERAASVWNMYGPTETTIWSSVLRLESGSGRVSLGGPIANTQLYVLDGSMKPLPIGVPGELYIAGDGVARGYHKRPELTAERFVANPFGAGKFYRTGDLVRYLPNGTLEFISRLDDQIKLHGFRIELGEIETVLAQVPGVRECTVVLREDVPGDKRLVAYVVASGTQLTNISDIRSILLAHLPDYMVPTTWLELPALPLTPNGKIDRKALPVPDRSRSTKEYVAPKTELETKLANIWAEVLHLDRVGVDDQIFELGADSLHVFQITARANQAGIKMSAHQLLQHRTISAVLKEVGRGTSAPVAPAIRAISRDQYRVKSNNN